MLLKLTIGLWVWAGALALVLVTGVFVLPLALRLVLGVAIIMVTACGCVLARRRAIEQGASLALAPGHALPAAGYRLPLVLVCGDGLPSLFEAANDDTLRVRLSAKACYLRVPQPEQLPAVVQQVLAARPHWARQMAVQWVINPAEHTDQARFAAGLRAWRHQLGLLRKGGLALPLLLTGYLPGQRAEGHWFSWRSGRSGLAVSEAGRWHGFEQWQQAPNDWAQRGLRLQTAVQVSSAADWWQQSVWVPLLEPDAFDPPCVAVAWALTLVPSWPQVLPGNLWQQWLQARTALEPGPMATASDARLPCADALMHLLPPPGPHRLRRQAGVRGLWLAVLAASLGMASSAWQNGLLLRQLDDDLRRYHALPQPLSREHAPFAAKQAAFEVLRHNAVLLDRHYRYGVPLHLGFGLYRAEPMRLPLLAVVAAHRTAAATPQLATAGVVRLDSLSLFDVASAQLKAGADRLLIKALVGIKARPGWLIVVAGHTDATGDERRNQQLSLARAQAVRDWMQRMGDIPDSCFAVQGHGARLPVASNDTPQGRGQNRRVDIRLVPEEGACGRPPVVAGAHVAQ